LSILTGYRPIRLEASVSGPFLMRVVDNGSVFAGQGISVVEAVCLRMARNNPGQMRERLEFLAHNTYSYMVVPDLYYIRVRASTKGGHSVSWLSAALGTALDIKPLLRGYRGETGLVAKVRGFKQGAETLFDYVSRRVTSGLLTPTLCVSYGGRLEDLNKLPGYASLRHVCAQHSVHLYEAPMSLTCMIDVGVSAITIGFASEEHEFAA